MEQHHVGMKISIHPDKKVEVEMHHMPVGGPVVGSGQPAQGMIADPIADGAKNAMDQALAPSAPAKTDQGGDEKAQFATELGSETKRKIPKAKSPTAGNQPKPKDKTGAPKAKPTGKLPAKNVEKNKSKAPGGGVAG
jgi:hypothetical protein